MAKAKGDPVTLRGKMSSYAFHGQNCHEERKKHQDTSVNFSEFWQRGMSPVMKEERSWVKWRIPVIPASGEAEAGGSFKASSAKARR